MAEDAIDVDRVIEEMEAVPQTRDRKMMLALAREVKALKGGGQKKGGQKKAAESEATGQNGSESEG